MLLLLLMVRLVSSWACVCVYTYNKEINMWAEARGNRVWAPRGVFVKSMVGHREEAPTATTGSGTGCFEFRFAERPTAADPSEVVTLVALATCSRIGELSGSMPWYAMI